MKLDKFKKIINNTTSEERELISKNMDMLERIHELLELKFGGKQNLLAAKMGKSEAEISKLLTGFQNYTMKTIIKFEIAFGAPILSVHTNKDIAKAHWVQAKIPDCLIEKQIIEASPEFEMSNTGFTIVNKTYSN